MKDLVRPFLIGLIACCLVCSCRSSIKKTYKDAQAPEPKAVQASKPEMKKLKPASLRSINTNQIKRVEAPNLVKKLPTDGSASKDRISKLRSTRTETDSFPPLKPGEKPTISFAYTEYKYGEVEEGTDVEHVFKFKNTGNAMLRIGKVRGG